LALNEKSIKQLIDKGVMELLPIQQFYFNEKSCKTLDNEIKMKY
jgi:hypothetical protein